MFILCFLSHSPHSSRVFKFLSSCIPNYFLIFCILENFTITPKIIRIHAIKRSGMSQNQLPGKESTTMQCCRGQAKIRKSFTEPH